ncbi:membrane protein FxsA [Rhizobium sp. XQZ8]|uniref:FxsA family protein n=1 Tax=Rhizobium populisoli TaxID=2859785 RepID=UPI001CA5BCBA|nr:FxsA family protein [Rhizobium populisoli]MBW6424550.1 membrane protein FxsA [Rhizobium populisoli]
MRFSIVPLFLLLWPLAEIAGFVLVGKVIGVWATLALVIGTALLGALLMRRQGMRLLRRVSAESRRGRAPGQALVHGAMVVVAGILLLLPGFLTDILGFALLIPAVRSFIWAQIGRRIVVTRTGAASAGAGFRYSRPPEDQGSARSKGNDKAGPVVDLDEEDFHRNPDPSGANLSPPNASSPRSSSPWAGPKTEEP